jgi:branched-chain amino acid transport system substrate-binding protein
LGSFSGGLLGAIAKEKEVVIGQISPLTGGAAFLGVDALKEAPIAMDEINAAGGITVAGQKYKIETSDFAQGLRAFMEKREPLFK